jgi:hypothetical protein
MIGMTSISVKEKTWEAEAEYNQLLDDLIVDDKEFNQFLEKSRESFSRV